MGIISCEKKWEIEIMNRKNWIFQRRLKRQTNSWWRLASLFIGEPLVALHCIGWSVSVSSSAYSHMIAFHSFILSQFLQLTVLDVQFVVLKWQEEHTPTTHYKHLLFYYKIPSRFMLIALSAYCTLLHPLFSAVGELHT